MYKLLALDMDGTLLKGDKTISDKTKKALEDAREKGVKVVLASGRPIQGLGRYLEELDLVKDNEYVLSYNGSLVQNVKTKEIISETTIKGSDVKRLKKISDKLGVYIHAFSKERGLIVETFNPYTNIECEINGIEAKIIDLSTVEDDEEIIKVMMIDSEENIDYAVSNIPQELHDEYHIARSTKHFLEFASKTANKGTGLQHLAEHLGISHKEIIAVGDAGNDLEMIELAGLGVAMGNAYQEVKEIANYITETNENNGIEKVIKEFIL